MGFGHLVFAYSWSTICFGCATTLKSKNITLEPREAELKNQLMNEIGSHDFLTQLDSMSKERWQIIRDELRIMSDMVCAFQKTGLPEIMVYFSIVYSSLMFGLIALLLQVAGWLVL